MLQSRQGLRYTLVAGGLIAAVFCGQLLAAASAPQTARLSQTQVIGQTGFAYLAGMRLVAAGLLNRQLEVQYHQYMQGTHYRDRTDLLPAIRLIQALNPQLEQPYYYTSYVLMRRGDWDAALALAREGIENNPTSGFLRANYIQLLIIQDKKANLAAATEQMRAALRPEMTYTSFEDQFEAYGVFRGLCVMIGDTSTEAWLATEQKRLRAEHAAQSEQGGGTAGPLDTWQDSAMPSEH